MRNKRPAFTHSELLSIVAQLRTFERSGIKRRTKQIRQLLRDYVHFVINTGARPGTELSTLRWTDIDTFESNGDTFLLINVDGKTGERELVASKRLQRYLDRCMRRNKSDSEYVFVLPDGSKPKDLHGAFELLLKSINLLHNRQGKKYSLYSLRHCYATDRLIKGVNMHVLARQMGTSTSMLEQHYSHVVPRLAANQLTA